jgi:hypothetical protein
MWEKIEIVKSQFFNDQEKVHLSQFYQNWFWKEKKMHENKNRCENGADIFSG